MKEKTSADRIESHLQNIQEWMYNNNKQDEWELRLKFWDTFDYEFQALLFNTETGEYFGESSYGSISIEEALRCLEEELPERTP